MTANHADADRRIAELTLETRDLAVLERVSVEAFGMAVLAREDDRIWLGVGEHARLGLWAPGEKEYGDRGGRHVHFAFSATPGGLDAAARAARDARCERPRPPGRGAGGLIRPHDH